MIFPSDIDRLADASEGRILVTADDDGIIEFANQKAENTFGVNFGEVIGRCVDTLLPEKYRVGYKAFRRAFNSNPKIRQMGVEMPLFGLRKNGTEFRIIVTLAPATFQMKNYVLAIITELTSDIGEVLP